MQLKEKPKVSEIDFKAEWFHKLEFLRKLSDKKHHPQKHVNPYEVPPFRKEDGTYCDQCDANMVVWENASDKIKAQFRAKAADQINCEVAWHDKRRD